MSVMAAVAGVAAGAAVAGVALVCRVLAFLLLRRLLDAGSRWLLCGCIGAGSCGIGGSSLLALLAGFLRRRFCRWPSIGAGGGGIGQRFLALLRFLGGGGRSIGRGGLIGGALRCSLSLLSSFSSWWLSWRFGRPVVLAAWGLAMALIPDSTNNMQSAIIHVLSLCCSLFMISSLVPDWPWSSGSAPQGVWGASRPVCGATIMTLRRIGVNRGMHAGWMWGGHSLAAAFDT